MHLKPAIKHGCSFSIDLAKMMFTDYFFFNIIIIFVEVVVVQTWWKIF